MDIEETWVPLEPTDCVFHTSDDGNVVAYRDEGNGMWGAIVRFRGDKYMKRTLPLTILNPPLIRALYARKAFKLGSSFGRTAS
jgi:hypothetical protein